MLNRVTVATALWAFAVLIFADPSSAEQPKLLGKIEGGRYTHPSGAFTVGAAHPPARDSQSGVDFLYMFGPSLTGWDLIYFLAPALSAGKTPADALTSMVADLNGSTYRRSKLRMSVLTTQEATVQGRPSLYAKLSLPEYPGTGLTEFGERGKQRPADFFGHVHLISIRDLDLRQGGIPIDYLVVFSAQAAPMVGEEAAAAAHAHLVADLEIVSRNAPATPSRPQAAEADYGTCPTNHVEQTKAFLRRDAALPAEPLVFPPRKFSYRATADGPAQNGYLVPAIVEVAGQDKPRKHTVGILFRNNEIVRKLEDGEVAWKEREDRVAPLPKDDREWRVGFSESGITEWVLPGETVERWSKLLTHKVYGDVSPGLAVARTMQGYRGEFEKTCKNVTWTTVAESAGEIMVERHTTGCKGSSDEHALDKLIRGVHSIVQVVYTSVAPLTADERAKWVDILGKVTLQGDCP